MYTVAGYFCFVFESVGIAIVVVEGLALYCDIQTVGECFWSSYGFVAIL
jgi:hypothetical protein